MMWQVIVSQEVEKKLALIQKTERERIIRAIKALGLGLRQSMQDIKPLKGQEDSWRMRVGKWRVIFEVIESEVVISVISFGPRGDIYKKSKK